MSQGRPGGIPSGWILRLSDPPKRSYDPRFQVGAVVVTREEHAGARDRLQRRSYAGRPRTRSSRPSPGHSGMIHAEINAMIKLRLQQPEPKDHVRGQHGHTTGTAPRRSSTAGSPRW